MAMNEKILDFVKLRGPILQNQARKHFKIDSTFVGAYLSQLVSQKKLKLTELKVGTSPVYYADGQEVKLQGFSKYLNEKDRKETLQFLDKHKEFIDSNIICEYVPLYNCLSKSKYKKTPNF